MKGGTDEAQLRHDLRQPLNIALLACSNLRRRIQPVLADDDAIYLDAKMLVIEQQIARLSEMLDAAEGRNRPAASLPDEGKGRAE